MRLPADFEVELAEMIYFFLVIYKIGQYKICKFVNGDVC